MTYIEFMNDAITHIECGVPIYTSAIAQKMAEEYSLSIKDAAAATSSGIKRIIDRKLIPELRCYQKGIYYRTRITPFGETGINKEMVIAEKYLNNNNGYITGLTLLHQMGLTTQIPAEQVLATNRAKGCIRADKMLGIFICPPKTRIDAENKDYLQILDAIDTMDKAPVDAEHPYRILAGHISKRKLEFQRLLALADKFYNKNTVLKLAHIAGEGGAPNETAFGH